MAVGQGYGVFYPDQGIILLNPEPIESEIGFSCHTGSTSIHQVQKILQDSL